VCFLFLFFFFHIYIEQLLLHIKRRRLRLRYRQTLIQHVEQAVWLIAETNRSENFEEKVKLLMQTDHSLEHREHFIMRHLIIVSRQLGIPIETVEEMKELVHMFVHDLEHVPIHPFDTYRDILVTLWRG
jgi:hypothetical protein